MSLVNVRTGFVTALLIAASLALFNPNMEAFRTFAAERAESLLLEETGDSMLGRLLSGAGGDLTAAYVERITERNDYLFFSTYTIDLDGRESDQNHWRFLGIAGQFLELERPAAVDTSADPATD